MTWISEELVSGCHSLGGKDTTAQVHPYKFTNFLLRKAVEEADGALELILGKVNKVLYLMETGGVTGIQYEPTSVKAAQSNSELGPFRLMGDQVVLSVGPWTSKILLIVQFRGCVLTPSQLHLIKTKVFLHTRFSPSTRQVTARMYLQRFTPEKMRSMCVEKVTLQ